MSTIIIISSKCTWIGGLRVTAVGVKNLLYLVSIYNHIQGCWNQGGRGVNCPPTLPENLAKLLQDKEFPLEFMSFAPPLLILPPHSYASSNTPERDQSLAENKYSSFIFLTRMI